MSSDHNVKTKLSEVLNFISRLAEGDFTKSLSSIDDPTLGPIVEKLNSAAKALAAQSAQDASYIVDSLGIGIWKWDLITNSLEWDKNMYQLYGADPSDFSGAYDAWENSLSDETKAKAVEEIKIAVAGGKSFDTTFQVIQRKTGKVQEVRTRAFLIRDGNGKPIKMWGINIDRTREAELEVELKSEQLKVMRSSKLASLGEMSAGIAHEINNPLAIIEGSVHLIPKFLKDPEKLKAKIETIKKACMRISKIVGGLKKLSRSSEEKKLSQYSLSSIAKEALVLTDFKSKRHSVPVTLKSSGDTAILCNEVEIEQVIINLVNNAIDAVKDKSDKWVELSIFDDQDSIVLRVIDSGNGLEETVRKKLFEPFFTTKNVGEGTGLGLSISKGILDEHQATITVIADCPNTCFEVRFPKAGVMTGALKNAA